MVSAHACGRSRGVETGAMNNSGARSDVSVATGSGRARATSTFRPDIQGIRALAVLLVVIYHAGGPLTGGFVGVDVFFVISGFLITRIIRSEIEEDRFSFARFYERRARRILPMLLLVIAVTTPAAAYYLMPDDFESYGKSVLSILAFASNIFFWFETRTYFGDIADLTVMLHTWSLGVEEQFYLVFPLVLILLARWRKEMIPAMLTLLTLGSLAVFAVGSFAVPSATFFLTPARVWELGLGVLIAYGVTPALSGSARQGAGWLGLVMILIAVLGMDEVSPFRGAAVITACFGAMLLIASGEEKPSAFSAHGLLATRPMVFIGLISYSLYLWHWPIIVLMRHRLGVFELPFVWGAVAMVTTLVLSALSWRYVEVPARNFRLFPTRLMVRGLGGGVLVAALAGVAIFLGKGMPARFDPQLLVLATPDRNPEKGRCFDRNPAPGKCALGAADASPSFIFWGDSHSDALFPAIDEAARMAGVGGVFAGLASCAPLVDAPSGVKQCDAFNAKTIEYVLARPEIERVILSSRWAFHMTDCSPLFESATICEAADDALRLDDPGAVRLRKGLENMVELLAAAGRSVTFIAGMPEYEFRPPAALVRLTRWDLEPAYVPDLAAVKRRNRIADEIQSELAASASVSIVSLREALCTPECELLRDGRATYVDDNHVSTTTGRTLLAPILSREIWDVAGEPVGEMRTSVLSGNQSGRAVE